MAQCRSCHAPVMWAKNDKTNKPAPLDDLPSPEGNIVLLAVVDSTGDPIYHVLTKKDRAERAHEGRQKYTSHFSTCPNRVQHRQ